jgi:alpha-glucoside transport system substrate-binding protein
MLPWLGILAAATLVCACGGDDDEDNTSGSETPTGGTPTGAAAGSVDVLGIWGSDELPKFEAMVAPWERDQSGDVQFTGTRDTTALLTTRVAGGNPPDIAIPAEIGLFQQFARQGELVPLSECGLEDQVRAQYPDSFIELGTVDGELYGFFMKADTKATIWYDPQTFEEEGWETLSNDSDFDDLIALSDEIKEGGLPPWSMGVESEAASGWPGSDWIQQIFINEQGEDAYDDLIAGNIQYTDSRVKDAWEKFGQIALTEGYVIQGSQGGAEGINATSFQDSAYPPFEDPPRAALLGLGGFASTFITERFPNAQPGEDFDFFSFPGGKVTIGANIVYAFNNDEGTCSLLRYLAGAEAQEIWVQAGGFTSINEEVDLDAYPDEVARNVAEQMLNADVVRMDLDDALGAATQQAIFTGVTEYLANPNQLDSILASIQAARTR